MGLLDLFGISFSEKPETVANFDCDAYMGDHFVLYGVTTPRDKGAHNAIESYRMTVDGTINVCYSWLDRSFKGEKNEVKAKAWQAEKPSEWKFQFIWPFKADYLITYQSTSKNLSVVTVRSKDLAWLMSHNNTASQKEINDALEWMQDNGYPMAKMTKIPRDDFNVIE
eukprot:CFRG0853T1